MDFVLERSAVITYIPPLGIFIRVHVFSIATNKRLGQEVADACPYIPSAQFDWIRMLPDSHLLKSTLQIDDFTLCSYCLCCHDVDVSYRRLLGFSPVVCACVCVNMGAGFREEMSRGLLYRHFTTNLLGRTLTFCLTHNITLHAVGVSLNEKRQKKVFI